MVQSLTLLLFSLLSTPARAEPPVLRLSLDSEPTTLQPHEVRTPSDRFLASFLFRGLLKSDSQGKTACDLCTSFTQSPDGKTWRFELDPEARWSDGLGLEAAHFLAPLARLRAQSPFPEKLQASAPSARALEIRLEQANSSLPFLLTRPESFPQHPKSKDVGLGPYVLAEWVKKKRLVLEGNPHSKEKRPVFRVEFHFGPRAELAKKFHQGRLDILAQPTTDEVLASKQAKVQVSPSLSVRLLTLHVQKEPLRDVALRKALLYALERESLPSVLGSGERAATGVLPFGVAGARTLPIVRKDLPRAQGERGRAVPMDRSISLQLVTGTSIADEKIAAWLAEQWKPLKIQVSRKALKETELLRALESGAFDLALHTYAFRTSSALDLLARYRTGDPSNSARWTSVAYDSLLNQALQETSSERNLKTLDALTQFLELAEIPLIPLSFPHSGFLLGPRVSTFAVTPFGDPDLVQISLK
jgi:oligopeptide transport system substrate-binding protein